MGKRQKKENSDINTELHIVHGKQEPPALVSDIKITHYWIKVCDINFEARVNKSPLNKAYSVIYYMTYQDELCNERLFTTIHEGTVSAEKLCLVLCSGSDIS